MRLSKITAIRLLAGLLVCLTSCRADDKASSSKPSFQISASSSVSATVSSAATSVTSPTTSPPSSTSISTSTKTSVSIPADAIQFYGRYVRTTEGGWSFDWPGVTMSAGFEGEGISVILNNSAKTNDYLACSVDGGPAFKLTVTPGKHRYSLADGLSAGRHTVALIKRTEGYRTGLLTLCSIDYQGGKAAPAPARPARHIEIVGDSITAGYGNESAPTQNQFRLYEENAAESYGYLAAVALDASCSLVAISGAGLAADYSGGNRLVPAYYNRALCRRGDTWNAALPPDVVVINLGTNDFRGRVDPSRYQTAYQHFLDRLRALYPTAHIVCAIGPMEPMAGQAAPYVRQAADKRAALGDKAVSYLRLELDGTDPSLWGGEGHPSLKGHRQLSTQLEAHLRQTVYA